MKERFLTIILVLVFILSISTYTSAKTKYDPSVDDVFDDAPSTTTRHTHKTKTKTIKATYFKTGYKIVICEKCNKQISKTTLKKLKLPSNQFSLISGKKSFKVRYKKIPYAKGFQVRYRIKGNWNFKTFNATKTCVKVLNKIKKGKNFVAIRGWKMNKGKKVYTEWSEIKSISVK